MINLSIWWGRRYPAVVDRHLAKSLANTASSTGCEGPPAVQWLGIQNMLEQAISDVLILLDCCAAASSSAETGNGVTEVIAACGFETWAPGVCKHSFTRTLIDELRKWSHRSAISAQCFIIRYSRV